MSGWQDTLLKIASNAEEAFDNLKYNFKKRLGLFDPIQICSYRSFASEDEAFIHGRVLEDKGITKSSDNDSIWNNIYNMYKRFESDEIPGAKLRVSFHGRTYDVVTDEEGYFEVAVKPVKELPLDQQWEKAQIEIIESPINSEQKVCGEALIMLPPRNAQYGVISDLDDTVVQSFATNRLRMARTVFLNNARTRLPFEGVSGFYKALQVGYDQQRQNPMFYVSSSPWNIYDFLIDFLDYHDIPLGPLMLRDTGMDKSKLYAKDHRAHKMIQIERVLNTYPDLQFILIGDSGQKDPVIYSEIIKKYPNRILACYIRDVNLPDRAKVVVDISEELGDQVPMMLVESTLKAAEDAVQRGFIPEVSLQYIQYAKEADEALEPQERKPEKETTAKVVENVREDIENEKLKETINEEAEEIDESEEIDEKTQH